MVYIHLTRYLTVLSNAVHYLNNSVSDETICVLAQSTLSVIIVKFLIMRGNVHLEYAFQLKPRRR